jgi:quercetin dioxygenase-like cupin family protein
MMLAIFVSASLIACNDKAKEEEKTTESTTSTQTTPAESDAVKAAPNIYTVLADTLGIRMLEAHINPGDSAAMHHHPENAIYVALGGTVTFYAKDGSKTENTLPAGATMIRPDEWHAAKNTGNATVDVILFEINRSGAVTTPDAKTDATKAASEVYKLKNDSLGIRVIEVNAKPGQSIAMHSHPDNALYVIDGGTAEFTGADGKKQTVELKTGMSLIGPAESHAVKNTGKTTMKAILVEVFKGQ